MVVVGCSGGNRLLEAETAIAAFTDSVVHTVCADFGGAAFRALLPGCCLEPLLAIVGDFGQGVLIVVEQGFDNFSVSPICGKKQRFRNPSLKTDQISGIGIFEKFLVPMDANFFSSVLKDNTLSENVV